MRYYFIDQDRQETVIDLNQFSSQESITVFNFKSSLGANVFYARRLADKLFGSWDKKTWFKLPQLSIGDVVTSQATVYKVYRGFKPSGLFQGGEGALVTQMPGKIVKIMVKAGDRVEKGQTILILEAMKMENEIKAGVTGVVKELLVSHGQALDAGVLMAEIEPD